MMASRLVNSWVKVVFAFSSCLLAGVSCGGKGAQTGPEYIPAMTNAIRCTVKKAGEPWRMDVSLKNITTNRIVFSKPRIVTGVDIGNALSLNSMECLLVWAQTNMASLSYMTTNSVRLLDENWSLNPGESGTFSFDLRDTMVARRCNLVPFAECFAEGELDMSLTLTVMSYTNQNEITISRSEPIVVRGKYIY
jgi:hypothetical protein